MTNPGVIPLQQADNVWQNLNNIGELRPYVNSINIDKPTTFLSNQSRIYADLSNSTVLNRLLFQTIVPDSYTALGLIPNGTHDTSAFSIFNSSLPDNSSVGTFSIDYLSVNLQAGKIGTGNYLPINFLTNGAISLTIDVSGNTDLNNNKLINVQNPIDLQDATTKFYVDSLVFDISGNLITYTNDVSGNLINYIDNKVVPTITPALSAVLNKGNEANNKITNLTSPTDDYDAVNKLYADSILQNSYSYTDQASSNLIDYINGKSITTETPALSAVLNKGNEAYDRITNLDSPIDLYDAVNKLYVDTLVAETSGQGGSGSLITPNLTQVLTQGNSAGSYRIINLQDPIDFQDAATKYYVDTHATSGSSGSGGPRWSLLLGGM